MEKDLFLSEYDEEKNCITLRLCGEIDHHSSAVMRHKIDEMLLMMQPKKLYLDLSTVDFMDSSGLGLIMGRYSLMERLNGETILLEPTERIKKILTLAGMDKRIRIEKRKVEANEKK
ncbi:MAG: anti-sigma factor antagonist [Clostridia bacterium]|nr:anti-sigma factor antagonist [Clostridia bacterium]